MDKIPEKYQDLLSDNIRAFATLATVMPDGSPQATPVWFSWDGTYVYVNSAQGRLKDRNMRERPAVALTAVDPTNPYRYIEFRGRVIDITTEGARDHINYLSKKYTGNPVYPSGPEEIRVMYKIQPEHVHVSG